MSGTMLDEEAPDLEQFEDAFEAPDTSQGGSTRELCFPRISFWCFDDEFEPPAHLALGTVWPISLNPRR